jgi:hypothetical protein
VTALRCDDTCDRLADRRYSTEGAASSGNREGARIARDRSKDLWACSTSVLSRVELPVPAANSALYNGLARHRVNERRAYRRRAAPSPP